MHTYQVETDLGPGCGLDYETPDTTLFSGAVSGSNLVAGSRLLCRFECLKDPACTHYTHGWGGSAWCVTSRSFRGPLQAGPTDCGSAGNTGVHTFRVEGRSVDAAAASRNQTTFVLVVTSGRSASTSFVNGFRNDSDINLGFEGLGTHMRDNNIQSVNDVDLCALRASLMQPPYCDPRASFCGFKVFPEHLAFCGKLDGVELGGAELGAAGPIGRLLRCNDGYPTKVVVLERADKDAQYASYSRAMLSSNCKFSLASAFRCEI